MGGPNFVEVDHGLGFTPFILYGEEAIIPLELLVPSLRLAVKFRLGDKESMARRLQKLVTMEEDRNHAEWSTQDSNRGRPTPTGEEGGWMRRSSSIMGSPSFSGEDRLPSEFTYGEWFSLEDLEAKLLPVNGSK